MVKVLRDSPKCVIELRPNHVSIMFVGEREEQGTTYCSDYTTVSRVRYFDNIGRASGRNYCNTPTQEKVYAHS